MAASAGRGWAGSSGRTPPRAVRAGCDENRADFLGGRRPGERRSVRTPMKTAIIGPLTRLRSPAKTGWRYPMNLPWRFPDPMVEARRPCRAFQRLPPDERLRLMLDTIAAGMILVHESP